MLSLFPSCYYVFFLPQAFPSEEDFFISASRFSDREWPFERYSAFLYSDIDAFFFSTVILAYNIYKFHTRQRLPPRPPEAQGDYFLPPPPEHW